MATALSSRVVKTTNICCIYFFATCYYHANFNIVSQLFPSTKPLCRFFFFLSRTSAFIAFVLIKFEIRFLEFATGELRQFHKYKSGRHSENFNLKTHNLALPVENTVLFTLYLRDTECHCDENCLSKAKVSKVCRVCRATRFQDRGELPNHNYGFPRRNTTTQPSKGFILTSSNKWWLKAVISV